MQQKNIKSGKVELMIDGAHFYILVRIEKKQQLISVLERFDLTLFVIVRVQPTARTCCRSRGRTIMLKSKYPLTEIPSSSLPTSHAALAGRAALLPR